jgi:hypothetical protein
VDVLLLFCGFGFGLGGLIWREAINITVVHAAQTEGAGATKNKNRTKSNNRKSNE